MESKEYFLKFLQSGKEWLTKANTMARNQNSRNLDGYAFSTDLYSKICFSWKNDAADLGVHVCGEDVGVEVPQVLVSGDSIEVSVG